MSHTEHTWRNDGSDPYGRPGAKGNADEVWRLLQELPCRDCGATSKRLVIEGRKADIHCGAPAWE